MKFLAFLFGFLTMISLCWVCSGTSLWLYAGQNAHVAPMHIQGGNPADEQAITDVSKGITGGLGVSFFACTGLPAAFVFFILTLACNASAESARRHAETIRQHEEMLRVQMQRNDVLGTMATVQMADSLKDRQRYMRPDDPRRKLPPN